MAYEKQEWNCGDTITADKMNHIEDGIANASGGGGVVYVTFEFYGGGYTADYTVAELLQEYQAGKRIVGQVLGEGNSLSFYYLRDVIINAYPKVLIFTRVRGYTSLDKTMDYIEVETVTMTESTPSDIIENEYVVVSSMRK